MNQLDTYHQLKQMLIEHPLSGAVFNDEQTHRYALWRIWNREGKKILFIGLNPSRAGITFNDPTIRRCIDFAKSWGYGGMYFGNLFSLRSPNPDDVRNNIKEAYNELTDMWLRAMSVECYEEVLCWGSWDFISDRIMAVKKMFPEAMCFGINKDGNPKHPLYLKGDSILFQYYKLQPV